MKTLYCQSLILILLCSVTSLVRGQTTDNSNSLRWASKPFAQNDFIENKGQFNGQSEISSGILFGAREGNVSIYFSSKGLTYHYVEVTEEETEEREEHSSAYEEAENKRIYKEEDEKRYKRVPHYLHMEWVGANAETEVIAEEKVHHYYTYSARDNNGQTIVADAYKKIIYKNLYPNIDVEYIIPEDKQGIKYSVILHPGADASLARMKYINEEKIFSDVEHNIVIASAFGNFTDHAPQTFYQKDSKAITSEFVLNGDEVFFRLGRYDTSKEVIIDPWTSSPNFTFVNSAYDVNFDMAGNVYAYGALLPFQLCKFNSAGVLQWTYNTPPVPPSNSICYGDFAVDEVTGTSYVAIGFNFTGASVYKVNTNGIQVAISPAIAQFNEIWRMEFNQCINKIIGAGGGTMGTNHGIVIDTSLATWNPVNVLGISNEVFHDMCLLSIDKTGNFCYMVSAESTAYTSYNNTLFKCSVPSLMPVFTVPSGHNFYEGANAFYIPILANANGFNGMTNSASRVYTYTGTNLKKWDKTNGALVSNLNLGGTPFLWGGIWSDECDNVYVGYQNTIRVYDSLFTQVNTFNLPGNVYDVKLGTNNKLYACGDGFVTSIDLPPTNLVTTSTPSDCQPCNGTAAVTSVACVGGPVTYLWQPGGQTTQTATGLCPGIYTVSITSNCNVITATVSVDTAGLPQVTVSAPQTICSGQSAVLTANGATTYSWSPSTALSATTGASVTASPSSTTTYTVTGDVNGCTATASVTVTVDSTPVALASADSAICTGDSIQLNASGGFAYLWYPSSGLSNANISNPVAAPISSTTYYVIVSSGACSDTDSVIITVLPTPVPNAGADAVICEGDSIQLNASGGNSYSWSPIVGLSNPNISNPVASPSITTNYVVSVFNGQCYGSDTMTVTVIPAPMVDLGPDIITDKGIPVTLIASTSATSFSWSPSNNLSCTNCQTVTVTPDTTTSYYVFVTDNNGCTNLDSVTVFIEGSFSIYIPNVFTPNGDLVNNIFYVYGENIKQLSMNIFNRWGEMIFESNDITKGWDGKYQGIPAPMGTYVYMVTFTGEEGAIETRTGKVSLIR